jgi:hypothetical protein
MVKRLIISLVAVLIVSAVIGKQTPLQLAQQPNVGQLSTEQRRAIQLVISSHAAPSDFYYLGPVIVRSSFKLSESIYIGLIMTNTASEPIRVCAFSNQYYQNRLQLTRDGQPVSYSENIRELVNQPGAQCVFTRSPDIVDLKSNDPYRARIIDLREWYGPLNPGHYTLFLKRTFACCDFYGQWNLTNVINFDIAP